MVQVACVSQALRQKLLLPGIAAPLRMLLQEAFDFGSSLEAPSARTQELFFKFATYCFLARFSGELVRSLAWVGGAEGTVRVPWRMEIQIRSGKDLRSRW